MKYARSARLLGAAGSGQLAKMVNQICIAGVVQGLAEAMHFAQQAGLDGQAVLDTISKGAAQSWQMENRGTTMVARQIRFWLCRGLDAQRRRCYAKRSPPQRCHFATDCFSRPVLCPGAGHGWWALGYVQFADCIAAQSLAFFHVSSHPDWCWLNLKSVPVTAECAPYAA